MMIHLLLILPGLVSLSQSHVLLSTFQVCPHSFSLLLWVAFVPPVFKLESNLVWWRLSWILHFWLSEVLGFLKDFALHISCFEGDLYRFSLPSISISFFPSHMIFVILTSSLNSSWIFFTVRVLCVFIVPASSALLSSMLKNTRLFFLLSCSWTSSMLFFIILLTCTHICFFHLRFLHIFL